MATPSLFTDPPHLEFRPTHSYCLDCRRILKVQKTHTRMVSTLHVGRFQATEVVLACPMCKCTYRSEQLGQLAPPGATIAAKSGWISCHAADFSTISMSFRG